jgi:pimeloyl-ACP methyl ester carboxylesterase
MIGESFEIPDILKIIATEPGLPLLITFAPVHSNGFALLARTSDLGYNTAHLRDPRDTWFQNGMSDALPSPEAVAAHLKGLIAELAPSRVVTVGSSMGGYAALLFAGLLKADAAIAFAPQTYLDRRLPHTPTSASKAQPWFDLATELPVQMLAETEVCFVYGSDDIVDIWNVTRMAALSHARRLAVHDQHHLVIKHMVQNGDFVRLVGHYCGGLELSLESRIDPRTEAPDVVELVGRLVPMLYLGAPDDEADDLCGRLIALHPDWAMPHAVQALIEKKRRRWTDAERCMARAAELSPKSLGFGLEHARLLMKLGQEAEAIIVLRRCLTLRRSDYATMCSLAILEARAGRRDVALATLETAIQVRPRLQRAQALRDRLLAGETLALPGIEEAPEDM